jgi:hypothetical protein
MDSIYPPFRVHNKRRGNIMDYEYNEWDKEMIKLIAEILEREYGNPYHEVVAKEIFDLLHPVASAAFRV